VLSKTPDSEQDRLSIIEKEMGILETIHTLIKKTMDYQKMGIDQSRWIAIEQTIRIQFSLISLKYPVVLDSDLHGLEICADPFIDRVFYHLMHNSISHGTALTRISFTCQEFPEYAVLICEDNGIGIPAEEKAAIFDRIVGGDGKFGLFFIREFLTISGMKISETGIPGKGARFEITIPRGIYRFTPGNSP
jgi:signal transduction histidine kinase